MVPFLFVFLGGSLVISGYFKKIEPSLFVLPLFLFAYFIYSPGLTGSFLLDDFGNLSQLSLLRGDASPGLIESGYLTLSNRPIAFLSFLIDSPSWPSSPKSFLHTNVLFHLLTAALVMLLFYKFALVIGVESTRCEWLALLGSALWVLSPFLMSTTLYIVQRMTILSALFSVAALCCYMHARCLLIFKPEKRIEPLLLITVLFPVFGAFAVLSKQNGVLLVVFTLVFELIYPLSISNRPSLWVWWRRLYLWLPSLVLPFVIIHQASGGGYEMRDFSLLERLLTQGRIVIEYVYFILIPQMQYPGLTNDHIVISKGLFAPISTFFSWLLIVITIAVAIFLRFRAPVIAIAILFFFVGHAIESTILPLELYFEHRNYLPSIFIYFALAFYACKLKASRALILAIILFSTFSIFSYSRSSLWGRPLLLTNSWLEANPYSSRSYQHVASVIANYDIASALEITERGQIFLPKDVFIRIFGIIYQCQLGESVSEKLLQMKDIVRVGVNIPRDDFIDNVEKLVILRERGACSFPSLNELEELILAMISNPTFNFKDFRYNKARLYTVLAEFASQDGEDLKSIKYHLSAVTAFPAFYYILNTAEKLSKSQPELVVAYIDAVAPLMEAELSVPSESLTDLSQQTYDRVMAIRDRMKIH